MRKLFSCFLILFPFFSQSQVDTTKSVDDFEEYGEVEYVGGENKSFANPKINGLAPQRFVSIAWDAQGNHDISFSDLGNYVPRSNWSSNEVVNVKYAGGIRFFANVPIISKNNLLWQLGLNYTDTKYIMSDLDSSAIILPKLKDKGLKSAGVFTTVYKPLNKIHFLLFQAQADLSGNYTLGNPQSLRFLRYSVAALWGKRPNDRLQWGLGISQTYRAGALNYFPVILYNKTSKSGKWGAELLLPAKGHARYRFNAKSLLLMGYELEGNSYRIDELSNSDYSFEIRRSEIRPRLEYQRQLIGFFWISIQTGLRLNYSFNADELKNGQDFYRGFFGNQSFAALSSMSTAPYFNLGIHFVSP